MVDVLYERSAILARGREKARPRAVCLALTPTSILCGSFHQKIMKMSCIVEGRYEKGKEFDDERVHGPPPDSGPE